ETLGRSLSQGEKKANPLALAALMDNNWFKFPVKDELYRDTLERKSRGLPPGLFTDWEYILVFNHKDKEYLERLRAAVLLARGIKFVKEDMGKIRLLGEYSGNKEVIIYEPKRIGEEKVQTREGWNGCVGVIKFAFKAFLKKQLGWVQPSPAKSQTAHD
ncbi:hypothetical protein LTS18_000583, partial [Coniosporium uncinatum]